MRLAFFTVRMRMGFGVDLVVDNWARGLAGRGHTVTVYCFDRDGETYTDSPYEIIPLHLSRDKTNKFLPAFEADAANTIRQLAKDLKARGETPDIALPSSFPFYGAGEILGCPTVHLHFGNPPTAGMRVAARINRRYLDLSDRHFMARARRIVTISEFLKSGLSQSCQSKTLVVYPGCDHLPTPGQAAVEAIIEKIENDFRKSNPGLAAAEKPFYVLCVSRLDFKSHPYKGVFELAGLLKAGRSPQFPAVLVLAGVGDAKSIEKLRELGAIVFPSPSPESLAALYAACDAYATLTRWEGFDLPVAEAASFGKPVIALNSTAHPENAVSCPIDNDVELLPALKKLVADADFYAECSSRSRELAAKFTWERSSGHFANAVEQSVSGQESGV